MGPNKNWSTDILNISYFNWTKKNIFHISIFKVILLYLSIFNIHQSVKKKKHSSNIFIFISLLYIHITYLSFLSLLFLYLNKCRIIYIYIYSDKKSFFFNIHVITFLMGLLKGLLRDLFHHNTRSWG